MRNVAVPDMLRVQGLVLLITVSAFKENLKGFLLFFPLLKASAFKEREKIKILTCARQA